MLKKLLKFSLGCYTHAHYFWAFWKDFEGFLCELSVEAMWMMSLNGPSEGSAMEPRIYYPERPGEPDCTFYMRTGACGFGANCKFNHPPGRLLHVSVYRSICLYVCVCVCVV